MASSLLNVIKGTGKVKHAVGNLAGWNFSTINQGAIVEGADIDNFTLVELGFNADGDRVCKQLSDKTKPAYLIASVERVFEFGVFTESLSDFFNAIGERARIVVLERGKHFDSSAYSLNAGVVTPTKGMVAHFDVATKKFIISASATPHADYATSSVKLLVVEVENAPMIDGLQTIRFEIQ